LTQIPAFGSNPSKLLVSGSCPGVHLFPGEKAATQVLDPTTEYLRISTTDLLFSSTCAVIFCVTIIVGNAFIFRKLLLSFPQRAPGVWPVVAADSLHKK
jgi:hypothetical protein